MRLNGCDRGSIVIGWLTKLIVVFAVVGVVLFDVISISAARLGAADDADGAASAAAMDYHNSHDVQSAWLAAVNSLPSDAETIAPKSFVINSDGSVHLVVRRTAKTLLVHRIGPLEHYGLVRETGDAPAPTA